MVGGTVIEVVNVGTRLWVNVEDGHRPGETCAIYVRNSERIKKGDSIWWQGKWAMWTPRDSLAPMCEHRDHITCLAKAGIDYDIKIPRLSYSGVERPEGAAA